jgi:hypothetical protein
MSDGSKARARPRRKASSLHNGPKAGLDAPCEFRDSRARAPPFVAPPSSTSGAWGGFGVLLYIAFWAEEMDFGSQRELTLGNFKR